MHDAHVHLDFMANAEQLAADAAAEGTLLFANTVTPDGHAAARRRFDGYANVRVGWGLHPWWVDADSTARAASVEGPYVGEVGLDFGKRHAGTRDLQLAAFTAIARVCAERGGAVMSLHAVGAARELLDVLEETGAAASCACVLHWYSGPSDQLKRAIQMGCLFSVGPRMVATGKGREYAKAIPASRLLLETDAPPHEGARYSFDQLKAELSQTAETLATIKGQDVAETMDATFRRLFL